MLFISVINNEKKIQLGSGIVYITVLMLYINVTPKLIACSHLLKELIL